MKNLLHILNDVLFFLLLPAVGLAYLAEDILQSYKKKAESIR